MTSARSFDSAGFLSSVASSCNGATLDSHGYTRDAVGNITQEVIGGANPSTSSFAYDDLYRLTSATVNGTSYSYVYDQVGNRLSQTAGGVTTSYSFDSADHLTAVNANAVTSDANGNITQDNTGGLYTWDARGRLIGLTKGGSTYAFTYGPDNLRLSKTVSGILTTYLLDGGQVVTDTINGTAYQNLFGPWTDHPLARNGEYFLPNHLSSTTGLTNGSGTLTQVYLYGPFGESLNVPSDSNPFQYTGRENDGDGLLYYRARYYCPTWGRFVSADPLGFGGGINPYVYADDDPVNETDAGGEAGREDRGSKTLWEMIGDMHSHPPSWVATFNRLAAIGMMGAAGPEGLELAGPEGLELGGQPSGGYTLHTEPVGSITPAPETTGGSGGGPYGGLTGTVNADGTVSTSGPCFPAGTPIATRGGEKPIEQIRDGDEVLSADPATGKQSYQRVQNAFTLDAAELLKIETADGRSVEATPVHPFWVKGKGFVAAKSLVKGERLKDAQGHLVQIVRISSRRGKFTVYNFSVANTHTYYAAGWWVHNAKECFDYALNLWKNRDDGWIYRVRPKGPPGMNLGAPMGWRHHDVFITIDGVVYDPMQGYPNGVPIDKWWSNPNLPGMPYVTDIPEPYEILPWDLQTFALHGY